MKQRPPTPPTPPTPLGADEPSLPPALAAGIGLFFVSLVGLAFVGLAGFGASAFLDPAQDDLDPIAVVAVASPVLVPCAVLALVAFLAALGHGAAWAFLRRQAGRLSVRLRPAGAASQCAYCHDVLLDAGALHVCGGCAASMHVDCFDEAQTCTTLGCAHNVRVERTLEGRSPGSGDPVLRADRALKERG